MLDGLRYRAPNCPIQSWTFADQSRTSKKPFCARPSVEFSAGSSLRTRISGLTGTGSPAGAPPGKGWRIVWLLGEAEQPWLTLLEGLNCSARIEGSSDGSSCPGLSCATLSIRPQGLRCCRPESFALSRDVRSGIHRAALEFDLKEAFQRTS